jgi:hypothetical protein
VGGPPGNPGAVGKGAPVVPPHEPQARTAARCPAGRRSVSAAVWRAPWCRCSLGGCSCRAWRSPGRWCRCTLAVVPSQYRLCLCAGFGVCLCAFLLCCRLASAPGRFSWVGPVGAGVGGVGGGPGGTMEAGTGEWCPRVLPLLLLMSCFLQIALPAAWFLTSPSGFPWGGGEVRGHAAGSARRADPGQRADGYQRIVQRPHVVWWQWMAPMRILYRISLGKVWRLAIDAMALKDNRRSKAWRYRQARMCLFRAAWVTVIAGSRRIELASVSPGLSGLS